MRASPFALLLALAVAACSYDWAYAAADAGADHGVLDATSDASTPADVESGGDSSSGAGPDAAEAAAEAEAPSLPLCTPQQQDALQAKRAAAIDCTGVTPMPCQQPVKDECGCTFYAATNNSAEAQYVLAVKQLLTTCVPICPTGCNPSDLGVCIVSDAGSATLTCH